MDATQAYGYIDTMQKICMDEGSYITLEEWLEENETEQKQYYYWMCKQVNGFYAGPYWDS